MAGEPLSGAAGALQARPFRSIRVRILAAFVLSLAAFSGALGYGLVQLRDIGEGLDALDSGYQPLARVSAELEAIARQMDREQDRSTREEPRSLARYRSTTAFYSATLADGIRRGRAVAEAAQGRIRDPDEQVALADALDLLAEIEASRASYDETFAQWDEQPDLDERATSRALADLDSRRSELILKVDAFAQVIERRIRMVSARTARAQSRAYAVSGTLAGLAVLLAGAMAGVALLTLRPIGQLTAQVQRLAKGDLVGRVQVRSRDEVGVLAREFNAMAEAVAERDRRLKERAEALDRLSLRLRQVLDTIQAGLVVVADGKAEMVNPAAVRLWGVEEGARLPPLLRALEPGRQEGRAAGDRRFDVDVVAFGERGTLVVGEDVTQRLRDRERLARSERLAVVGQMLAQITHEVRNPLNAMSLNAELLVEDLEGTDHHEVIVTITREIRRLEALTARYLELSRGRRPELTPIDPLELVRDVLRIEEVALRRDGVTVSVSGADTGVVDLDVDAVRRALRNLLLNAVEAGAHTVGMAVSRHDTRLRFTVTDDGPGMSDAQRARIFEPFYTTKARGTGLGLAISRQELEDVGGTIRVQPGEGGIGSVFEVEVPVEEG